MAQTRLFATVPLRQKSVHPRPYTSLPTRLAFFFIPGSPSDHESVTFVSFRYLEQPRVLSPLSIVEVRYG